MRRLLLLAILLTTALAVSSGWRQQDSAQLLPTPETEPEFSLPRTEVQPSPFQGAPILAEKEKQTAWFAAWPQSSIPAQRAWMELHHRGEFFEYEDRGVPLSDPERATLAYVAADVAHLCKRWVRPPGDQGKPLLECPLNKTLRFGHQCSDEHLAYLKKWFGEAAPESCAMVPYTATFQSAFTHLAISTKGNQITLRYDVIEADSFGLGVPIIETTAVFRLKGKRLFLTSRTERSRCEHQRGLCAQKRNYSRASVIRALHRAQLAPYFP